LQGLWCTFKNLSSFLHLSFLSGFVTLCCLSLSCSLSFSLLSFFSFFLLFFFLLFLMFLLSFFFLAPLTWVLKASFIGKDRRMVASFHNHSSQLTLLPCPSCKLVEGTCTSFSQFWLIWVVFFVVFCKFLGVKNRRENGCN